MKVDIDEVKKKKKRNFLSSPKIREA